MNEVRKGLHARGSERSLLPIFHENISALDFLDS